VKGIGVHKLVIGYDHHFGRNREGSLEQLKLMAPNYHFEVEEIPAQDINDVNVSSTKIRNALLSGEVDLANTYLGYQYRITGFVVQGNAMGRSIGYPTANLQPVNPNKLIPGNGVYTVDASVGGQTYRGMANIGHRPTVVRAQREPTIEVHLFDFDGDIYGQSISITFVQRIRDEIKFSNVEALRQQLQKDAEKARMDHNAHDLRTDRKS
jgi:riboflavin kinase/FMN adenylyltransferase